MTLQMQQLPMVWKGKERDEPTAGKLQIIVLQAHIYTHTLHYMLDWSNLPLSSPLTLFHTCRYTNKRTEPLREKPKLTQSEHEEPFPLALFSTSLFLSLPLLVLAHCVMV